MQIRIVKLVVLLLGLALFPRLLSSIGFPKLVVFFHFAITPVLFLLTFRKSLNYVLLRHVAVTIFVLFCVMLISMNINEAGVVNLLLSFLMIVSPVMLIVAMCSVVWSRDSILMFEKFIVIFLLVHTAFAFTQFFLLGYRGDDVEGVFIGMGAGGHIAGAISAISSLWILKIKWIFFRLRYFLAIASIVVVFLSDSKQVIAVLGLSSAIYFFAVGENITEKLKLIGISVCSVGLLFVIASTVFPGLLVYLQDNKLFDGLEQKMIVIPVIISFYDGWFSWLFGLGPGHSVSRLATMLPSYDFLSSSLGATMHDATGVVLMVKESQLFSNSVTGSSMFALDFSLAGIWGDLGIIGLTLFVCIYMMIWRLAGEADKLSKFFIVSVFVYGFVFTWVEEPAFMLYLMAYVGYAWQKSKLGCINENSTNT